MADRVELTARTMMHFASSEAMAKSAYKTTIALISKRFEVSDYLKTKDVHPAIAFEKRILESQSIFTEHRRISRKL